MQGAQSGAEETSTLGHGSEQGHQTARGTDARATESGQTPERYETYERPPTGITPSSGWEHGFTPYRTDHEDLKPDTGSTPVVPPEYKVPAVSSRQAAGSLGPPQRVHNERRERN